MASALEHLEAALDEAGRAQAVGLSTVGAQLALDRAVADLRRAAVREQEAQRRERANG